MFILPPGVTADRHVIIQYLRDTGLRFNNLKKGKIKLGELSLMRDNARPYAAQDTRAFVCQKDVELVKQPAYSPDLNQCDAASGPCC